MQEALKRHTDYLIPRFGSMRETRKLTHRLFNMAPRPPLNGRQNDQIHVILGIEKFRLPLARPTEVAPVEIDVVAGWQIKTAQHPDQSRLEESGRRSSNHVMNDEHV